MDQLWWTHINSANRFVRKIIESMPNEKSLIVCLPERVPWYETMRQIIEGEIARQNAMRQFKYRLEAQLKERNPGKYLFERYCSENLKLKYRPQRSSYAKFLAEDNGNTLNQAYIWLRLDSRRCAEAWINFVNEYRQCLGNKVGGVFLIEVRDESLMTRGRWIETLSYNRMIGPYDRFIFNMLAASDFVGQSALMKQYLAELVSNVVGNDIELSAKCISMGERFITDPRGAIRSIIENSRRSDGTRYEFDRNDDYIDQCKWTTQIKLVFPLIENFRRRFIERYRIEIDRCLPSPSGYGEMIDEPKEADIGFLYHNAYLWGLPTDEWDRLRMYRDARNSLAHMKPLTSDELQIIFNES